MKLQYASDLHLEFPENKNFLKANPILPQCEILILAGDITPFAVLNNQSDFLDYLSDNFKTTYWLPGNHEYYNSDINERTGQLNEKIRENIILVNNISVELNNAEANLIFSTLWSHITPEYKYVITDSYSDFRIIRNGDRLLDIETYNLLHKECVSFLKTKLSEQRKGRTAVVTHHLPTFCNYPEEYKADPFNEAFATELSDLILDYEPYYWIFGHHHRNNGDFMLGNTKIVTNQLGYLVYNENKAFSRSKCIEI